VIIEHYGDASVKVDFVVKVASGVKAGTIVVLDGEPGSGTLGKSCEVGAPPVESRIWLAISATNVNVDLGVMIAWESDGVKDGSVGVKLADGVVDNLGIG
jgi:hypothetical protein